MSSIWVNRGIGSGFLSGFFMLRGYDGKIDPVKVAKISLALKALRELGPRQLGLYALYQVGLWTGYFRWATEDRRQKTEKFRPPFPVLGHVLDLPDPAEILAVIGSDGLSQLKAEANEIAEGQVRLFGGQPVPLDLTLPSNLPHWTKSKSISTLNPQPLTLNDIKFTWEPARFGWAFTLGRAYRLTGDERYPETFWRYFETFIEANPVNMGPNWSSGQEVALRLIAFTFAAQIFASSPASTATRNSQLASSIAAHAARIPPTLIYARSQNNNHLLSEAAGLITASLVLLDHPRAKYWSKLGWKWFNRGLESQIASDGTYVQHSTNYHRLMLQLALWVNQIQKAESQMSNLAASNLQLATRWLLVLTDPISGRVPNLGPNDGAYILPLSVLPFQDYRPILQAASQTLLEENVFESGDWDEMSLWLNRRRSNIQTSKRSNVESPNTLPVIKSSNSWAYLRAATFHDRPGHADQLHLDLWWRGLNIVQDAGTYLYNADPPWDNALTHTAVHNTLTIDNHEQMTRAGRFLYLDRAQAEVIEHERDENGSWEKIVARHNGYFRIGIIHNRSVTARDDGCWIVVDYLQPTNDSVLRTSHTVRLHWLLPDWEYDLLDEECGMQNAECGIRILSPHGWISLGVQTHSDTTLQSGSFNSQLVRAGELLYGSGTVSPTWGWVSPTYGIKVPALSFSVSVAGQLPMTLISEFVFPEAE